VVAMSAIPIFINVRDLLTPLKAQVAWLERAGHENITLLDNCSSYPPLIDYLADTPHKVVRLGENLGSHSIWLAGLAPDEPYVFTDPDIVPIDECPLDAVEHLATLLGRHDGPKVGFGLYMKDLPDTIDPGIVRWETGPEIRGTMVGDGVRQSLVDTTFAVYRGSVKEHTYRGLRTEHPYLARHLSPGWYGGELTDEHRYYLAHAIKGPLGSSWAQAEAA
jgi:hypothetical protein